MKKTILILMIICAVSMTSCSSTDKADINEFIKRYNSISEFSISKENLIVNNNDNRTIYSLLLDENIILTLVSNNYCEIVECSISTQTQNQHNKFIDVCTYTLMSLTGYDKTSISKAIIESFSKPIITDEYEVNLNKDNLQTTIIIRLLTNNKNIKPTLKEFLNNINN